MNGPTTELTAQFRRPLEPHADRTGMGDRKPNRRFGTQESKGSVSCGLEAPPLCGRGPCLCDELVPVRPVVTEKQPGAAVTPSHDCDASRAWVRTIDYLRAITIPAAARAMEETLFGGQCIIPPING